MADRDDIVIVPTLTEERAAAPVPEREARRVPGRRRASMFRRLAQARAARRLARARAARRVSRPSRPSIGRRLAGGAARLATGVPISAMVAAAILLAREKSGRTFGGMGAEIRKEVLGETALQAIARTVATRRLATNAFAQDFAARRGTTALLPIHTAFTKHAYQEAKGTALFLEDPRFDVRGLLDMMVERGREMLTGQRSGIGR